jgi:hypothetical protein
VFTRYRAGIPWLDDARVRPDEILPRRRRLDLKKRIGQAWFNFRQAKRGNSEVDAMKQESYGP